MLEYTGKDIYCDLVIPRKIDIRVVFESENVLAYHHTKPFWEHHVVVTPKQHIGSFLDLEFPSPIAKEILNTIKTIAADMQQKYGSCRILTNLGEYQDSKHLHFHIVHGTLLNQN